MTRSDNDAMRLRALHELRPLILPNAWDAASARLIEACGAQAIATTSGGMSWAYGRKDGQSLTREQMLTALARIVDAVALPISADIESGYGDVAQSVRAVVDIGVAGVNLEDSPGPDGATLLTAEAHAERIRAARAAASNLVINARTDVYLFQVGVPESRFEEVVRRAALYLNAGADCIFVPGVVDAETIRHLVRAINAPINIMAAFGAPAIGELGALGVARVSVGSALAQLALTATGQAVHELLTSGTYRSLEGARAFADINALFLA